MKNPHAGSRFDDFLRDEGLYDDVKALTVKRALAMELTEAMHRKKCSKQTLAKRMNTSRAALDRLLDPTNAAVTLRTIAKAASILGYDVRLTFSSI